MSFEDYAATNYANRDEFEIPREFANVSKMNSVPGDQVDSLASPLRAEFYSEAAVVSSAVTGVISVVELQNDHGVVPGIVLAASTAVMGLGSVVRHRARAAVNGILKH